jgi:hypothetical protein
MKTTLSITSTVSATEPTTATVVTHHPPGETPRERRRPPRWTSSRRFVENAARCAKPPLISQDLDVGTITDDFV